MVSFDRQQPFGLVAQPSEEATCGRFSWSCPEAAATFNGWTVCSQPTKTWRCIIKACGEACIISTSPNKPKPSISAKPCGGFNDAVQLREDDVLHLL